ncbi:hypothetical protein MMC11_004430 [Xylographa trunciseda]|nr:hypothetical protein [Xylographa trunciseda]
MKSSIFLALSLLAVNGPSLTLAQEMLQEIDEGNGVFGVGFVVPAAPAAPVAPANAPAAPAAPAPVSVAPQVVPAAPAPSPTTMVAVPAGNILANEGIVTHSPTSKAPPAPTGFVDGCTSVNTRYLTISVTNSWTADLTAFLGSNYGAPTPVGNPAPTVLPPSAATSYVFPPCWAGRISLDPSSDSNPFASKIEGSAGSNQSKDLDLDVSYVDGYTVPITCSSSGKVVVGCNIDLFGAGDCGGNGEVLDDSGTGCWNPTNTVVGNGPPTKFFAPCAGAAYTFPNDNDANNGAVAETVSCCIGSACTPSVLQGKSAASKRDTEAPLQRASFLLNREASGTDVAVRSPEAGVGAHLRAHKHRHGLKKRHAHHFS